MQSKRKGKKGRDITIRLAKKYVQKEAVFQILQLNAFSSEMK